MDFCFRKNIPHPKTISLNESNIDIAANYIGFPALIKPDYSSGSVGIVHISSYEELIETFSISKKNYGNLTLQSYVDNPGYYYNAMLYRDKQGQFSKAIIIKIERYFPIKGGTGSYSKVVEHPTIENICKEVLNKLNWIGFADFDFIVDKKTEAPKLIEINPRIPACIHTAFISGINFPQIIVFDTLGLNIPQQKYVSGRNIRYFAMDVLWFLFSPDRFRAKPSWFNFFQKNLYYQDGSWDDPLTMFAGIIMGALKYLNPSFRKSKLKNT